MLGLCQVRPSLLGADGRQKPLPAQRDSLLTRGEGRAEKAQERSWHHLGSCRRLQRGQDIGTRSIRDAEKRVGCCTHSRQCVRRLRTGTSQAAEGRQTAPVWVTCGLSDLLPFVSPSGLISKMSSPFYRQKVEAERNEVICPRLPCSVRDLFGEPLNNLIMRGEVG